MPATLNAVRADLLNHLLGCPTCHIDGFICFKRRNADSLTDFEEREPAPAWAQG